jgi:transposase InsO family protein
MSGNQEKLHDFVTFNGGIVRFGSGVRRITRKGTIRTPNVDFENVYYVKELQGFNLFSVSQICDKKLPVLFTEEGCHILSPEFKLPDDKFVLLKAPRNHNLYTFDLNDVKPEGDLTCLVAKASLDESTKWHRRMAHVNFKVINKLAKDGLVHGLPTKIFTNEHNCVACNKGKQHRASYKAITAVSTISEPLQLLHMDLFGPTSIRSIDQKYFCLVITDSFSRFSWTFFLMTKDQTFQALKEFMALIENQLNKKIKSIRYDNGTEFKNAQLIELCGQKGIKRDYSTPRTPQQNGVAERKNRTLIEAARSMLADSKLPTMFWTEAVGTACYVLNRVLITRPHNKTPYELLTGKKPTIEHLKPFGCQVTILNTSDHLGKFDAKAAEGYIVGYSAHSKAYRVYNLAAKKIEETLNMKFLEENENVQGKGHEWYFDLDYLTDYLGYARHTTNPSAGIQVSSSNSAGALQDDSDSDSECDEPTIVVTTLPIHIADPPNKETTDAKSADDVDNSTYAEDLARLKKQEHAAAKEAKRLGTEFAQDTEALLKQAVVEESRKTFSADVSADAAVDSADGDSADNNSAAVLVSTTTSTSLDEPYGRFPIPSDLANVEQSDGIFQSASYDEDFAPTITNLDTSIDVNLVVTKRINTIHPQDNILGDPNAMVLIRNAIKNTKFGQCAFLTYVSTQKRDNHTDQKHCLFACFLSQVEPTSIK